MKYKMKVYKPKEPIVVPEELTKEFRRIRSNESKRAITDYVWSKVIEQGIVPEIREQESNKKMIRMEKLPINKKSGASVIGLEE